MACPGCASATRRSCPRCPAPTPTFRPSWWAKRSPLRYWMDDRLAEIELDRKNEVPPTPIRRHREWRGAPHHGDGLLIDAGDARTARQPHRSHPPATVQGERYGGSPLAAGTPLVAREMREHAAVVVGSEGGPPGAGGIC